MLLTTLPTVLAVWHCDCASQNWKNGKSPNSGTEAKVVWGLETRLFSLVLRTARSTSLAHEPVLNRAGRTHSRAGSPGRFSTGHPGTRSLRHRPWISSELAPWEGSPRRLDQPPAASRSAATLPRLCPCTPGKRLSAREDGLPAHLVGRGPFGLAAANPGPPVQPAAGRPETAMETAPPAPRNAAVERVEALERLVACLHPLQAG